MSYRVEGLEGMRGIAAFYVFTHHFLLIFYPSYYFGQHNWTNHILNPDLAVSWFFVHSGYVLSLKGVDLAGTDYWQHLKDQAARRYLRLLPLVLFSIILTYLCMNLNMTFNHEFGKKMNSVWLSQYLNFNPDIGEALKQAFYGVYFSFKSSSTYNPNLWTIGHELISSYLLFALLAAIGWWKKSAWFFVLIAFAIGPWKGMMCFMLGAALTRLPKFNLHPYSIGVIGAAGFYLSDLKGVYEAHARSVGATLLMLALLHAPRARAWLNTKIIHRLGELSYSLYVLHFLVLISFTSWLGLLWKPQESMLKVTVLYLLTSAILILVSHLAWRYVDIPGIKIAKKFSAKLLSYRSQK